MLNQALDWIINNIAGPVFIKDRLGRYVMANVGTARLFGLDKVDGIIGKTDHDLRPDAPDAISIRERDQQAINAGRVTVHEVEYIDPDGIIHWFISSRVALLGTNGDIVGLACMSEEITDQKRNGRVQEDNQELRTRFLSSASHDLRQPLQAMYMSAEGLKKHVSAEGLTLLEKLESGLSAQRKMLDGMLDVSSLDAGITKLNIEDFAIGEVIAPLLGDLRDEAERKGLLFENRLEYSHQRILSDRFMFGRIIVNYVENAVRFTPSGSVSIDGIVSDENLIVCISDTGIGIEADDLGTIWNEFYQVNNAERWRKNGLGLGLPVVRRMATMLNHRVWVKSSKGHGAKFYISVPLASTLSNGLASDVTQSEVKEPVLLFVDDDDLVRDSFGFVLREMGFNTIVAESTSDALTQLDGSSAPEVLVLDYRLRGETGIDCVQAIRMRFNQAIPAILLTGDLQQSVQDLARHHNMLLLHKPVSVKTLAVEIERLRRGTSNQE